ncbi:hypothetical protein BO86DRAFT_91338 [Aspergillus japonicus CBS 114.51]|uniref:Uncharacterized protein n=1 Tax=Aspergillus japonicus CBS 114.51 TaxID=1448312 RepID=A0A8T8X221_ASPJA|nr:hypothetical protein BO86DRAFT_91338 [Aspergillus japonicus CBS 114.51]RAH81974.1 hypothetical protein BO86DRAFT_91338 [Aspergillus japonicus CBS 114.51]
MADTQGLPGGWPSIVPSYLYTPEDDLRALTMAASFQPARRATNSLLGTSAPPQHPDPTAQPSELTPTPTYLNTSMQWTMAPLGTEFSPGAVPYLVDPWRPRRTLRSTHLPVAPAAKISSLSRHPAKLDRECTTKSLFPLQPGPAAAAAAPSKKPFLSPPPLAFPSVVMAVFIASIGAGPGTVALFQSSNNKRDS